MKKKLRMQKIVSFILCLMMLQNCITVFGDVPVLDEEVEEFLRNDYLQIKKAENPDDSHYQNMTLEDVIVEKYYGSYSGCEVVSMRIADMMEDAAICTIYIAGYRFEFPSTQAATRLYAYKDSSFTQLKEAYNAGIITKEDVRQIALMRGSITSIDEFVDIEQGAWYYDAVKYTVESELFVGSSDDYFLPEVSMNRAMFVTVLSRLAARGGVYIYGFTSSFQDVNKNEWYGDAVAWAVSNGIVSGYNSQIFGPEDDISREQMMVLLVRFSDYMELNLDSDVNSDSFSDSSYISDWAKDAVEKGVSAGLINGYPDGTFKPQGTAIRAQVATVFMKFTDKYFN